MTLNDIKNDIFGGVTAAIVALPLALAFGVSSGAGALAGLYGAIFSGFFAAVFGGTRQQVTGPTGPMTVVMAMVITQFEGNVAIAFSAVIVAGVLQIIFGKLGIGRYINLMPQPVVSGFMSGIGVIIIILQLAPLIGQAAPEGEIILKLLALPGLLPAMDINAFILGLFTLSIMFFTPKRVAKMMPPPLIAIFVGSLSGYFIFSTAPIIGTIPSGTPSFHTLEFPISEIPRIIQYALILAFLGAIDSLLTSLVADSMTKTSHNSNKELVGQGIGNIAAGLFGGLPGAGATMRTMVNIRAGGQTEMSGALHSVLLLAIVVGFGKAASYIPLTVLAGILIKVGIDIIDWGYIKRAHKLPKSSITIMLTTLGITVFIDLITAVAVGFVMASVIFVSRLADVQIKNAKFQYGSDHLDDLTEQERQILESHKNHIVLFQLEGPLSFGSARQIAKLLQRNLEKDVLIIDMSRIPFIDDSAATALDEVIEYLHQIKDSVIISGASQEVMNTLERTGITTLLDKKFFIQKRLVALELAKELIEV